LLSTFGQNIEMEFEFAEGVQFNGLAASAYEVKDNTVRIPDILGGETKYLLMRLKLPKKTRAVCARESKVMDVKVTYADVGLAKKVALGTSLKVQYVRRKEDASVEQNPLVKAQMDIALTAEVIQEARKQADRGEFEQAKNLLRSHHAYSSCRGVDVRLCDDIASLESSMADRDSYAHARNSIIGTSTAYTMRRATGSSRSADVMFMSAAQEHTSELFASEENEIPAPPMPPVVSTSVTVPPPPLPVVHPRRDSK